jgi:F-type H+-transporting ATPase subunit b
MQTAAIFLLPNGTFFVELAIFLIIVFLIAKYILPPVNRAMEQRQEHIKNSLEAADAARAEAMAANTEREAELRKAKQHGHEIVATANRTGEQIVVEAQARAQAEHDRILANAQTEIELLRRRAVEDAASRMGALVLDVVERVIGREVDSAAHRDLIDEAVAALTSDADETTAGAGSRP